jgi:cytochrome P450
MIEFDPFSAAAHADPYPIYRRLRDEWPVYHNPRRGFWAVSRYEDVALVSRDWERFTVQRGVDIDNVGDVLGEGFFLAQDPPVHGKMRGVVKHAFALRTIAELEPAIRREVETLVRELAAQDEPDLATGLAWRLPARAMAALLGYPTGDAEHLRELAMRFMTRTLGDPVPPAVSDDAGIALMDYFETQVRACARRPREGLLSTMATASIDGEPIGDAAVGMALLIFVGGFENVACAITNALYWLERHPDQRARLAADPSGIDAAGEEVLRYDGPQQNFKRTATRDVTMHGVTIPAGAPVFLLYGSANRDERHFPDPDRFDVTRTGQRHLSFGDGIHHCLGAPMARLESRIVLETVLRDIPDYELAGEPRRVPNHAVRGFLTLPARLPAGAPIPPV